MPIFIWQNEDKNYCLDGHGRLRVLNKEKIEFENSGHDIPVYRIQADSFAEAKEKLLKITSQYQSITYEGLQLFIDQAELPEAEIYEAVHFDALPMLGQQEAPDTEEDEAPELDTTGPATSVLGEVYQLGDHRLMCGDSTKQEDFAKLMGGVKAKMVFTDPPYNVDYVKLNVNRKDNKKGKAWRYNPIKGDNMESSAFVAFLTDSFNNLKLHSEDNAPWYVWHAHQSAREFLTALDANELVDRQTLIWAKPSMVLGHSDYQWRHEPCYYVKRVQSGKVPYYGNRKQTSVWELKRDNTSEYKHPTQKPIELVAIALTNSSQKGDVVVDGFGGSGSTLMACEQLGRVNYSMELDPGYCDVIRKRWWKFKNEGVEDGWEENTAPIQTTGS